MTTRAAAQTASEVSRTREQPSYYDLFSHQRDGVKKVAIRP
jgi:hypothetical protein